MKRVLLFLIFFSPLSLFSQSNFCEQFSNFDKFNSYYCDECPNLTNLKLQNFNSAELGFSISVPSSFHIVEFYKDNKVLVYDSLARKNYKSFSISTLDNHLGHTLDAFFLEYINTFFDNFILDENQFFNYGNFYAPNYNGKYLYRSYYQASDNLFELSIFFYKRPNVYLIRFMGFQNNYYELLCDYLPIAYSFKIN